MPGILILPSLITLGSTFCGFLAISYVANAAAVAETVGGLERAYAIIGRAGWLLGLAMIFDALDGRVARMSHQTTEFGGQLDSLSDTVSFGVAPAFMAKVLVEIRYPELNPKITLLVSAIYVVCAILRLARYNVEHDSQVTGLDYFRGLPSPGAAGLIAAVALVVAGIAEDGDDPGLVIQTLPVFTFLTAILMISRFRYVHVMNRFMRGRKPFTFLVVILFVLVFIVIVSFDRAAAIIIVLFVLSGPSVYVFNRITGRHKVEEDTLFD
jgi:CDP-diacylglycerol--serine O-phosphatidyltransferase